MKKSILFILIFTLIFSLIGCGEPDPEPTVFDTITSMLALDDYFYASMTVTENTSLGKLNSSYELSGREKTDVSFTFEAFVPFDPNSPPPTELKVTYRGSMVIRDGEIVNQSGDVLNVSVEEIRAGNLSFKAEYFTDVNEIDGLVSATVINPEGFMGVSGATGMTVQVSYNTRISSITIAYTTKNGNTVSIIYNLG